MPPFSLMSEHHIVDDMLALCFIYIIFFVVWWAWVLPIHILAAYAFPLLVIIAAMLSCALITGMLPHMNHWSSYYYHLHTPFCLVAAERCSCRRTLLFLYARDMPMVMRAPCCYIYQRARDACEKRHAREDISSRWVPLLLSDGFTLQSYAMAYYYYDIVSVYERHVAISAVIITLYCLLIYAFFVCFYFPPYFPLCWFFADLPFVVSFRYIGYYLFADAVVYCFACLLLPLQRHCFSADGSRHLLWYCYIYHFQHFIFFLQRVTLERRWYARHDEEMPMAWELICFHIYIYGAAICFLPVYYISVCLHYLLFALFSHFVVCYCYLFIERFTVDMRLFHRYAAVYFSRIHDGGSTPCSLCFRQFFMLSIFRKAHIAVFRFHWAFADAICRPPRAYTRNIFFDTPLPGAYHATPSPSSIAILLLHHFTARAFWWHSVCLFERAAEMRLRLFSYLLYILLHIFKRGEMPMLILLYLYIERMVCFISCYIFYMPPCRRAILLLCRLFAAYCHLLFFSSAIYILSPPWPRSSFTIYRLSLRYAPLCATPTAALWYYYNIIIIILLCHIIILRHEHYLLFIFVFLPSIYIYIIYYYWCHIHVLLSSSLLLLHSYIVNNTCHAAAAYLLLRCLIAYYILPLMLIFLGLSYTLLPHCRHYCHYAITYCHYYSFTSILATTYAYTIICFCFGTNQ